MEQALEQRGDVAPEVEALIFDLQRFSLHDGPGIRTTVFFKGCPLSCAWCQNPESLRPQVEVAFRVERCHGVGDCVRACPLDAIQLTGERLDRDRCEGCGLCVDACPHGAFELLGRSLTVDGLLAEVLRDKPFYEASGGGVTLSGGEPTAQMSFVHAFVRRCRAAGVSVGMQTAGVFSWSAFAPTLPLLQFIHYDIKLIDDDGHRQLVGASSRPVLDNARRLVAANAPVTFRTPVIPGYTDSAGNLQAVAAFLLELGATSIQLLRYHSMGEAKLAPLGHPMSALHLARHARSREPFERATRLLEDAGLEVVV